MGKFLAKQAQGQQFRLQWSVYNSNTQKTILDPQSKLAR